MDLTYSYDGSWFRISFCIGKYKLKLLCFRLLPHVYEYFDIPIMVLIKWSVDEWIEMQGIEFQNVDGSKIQIPDMDFGCNSLQIFPTMSSWIEERPI